MAEEKIEMSADNHYAKDAANGPDADALAFAPVWMKRGELKPFGAAPGITMQSIWGGALMANWVTIEPNCPMPMHRHHNEQLGVVLEGSMELTMGDETRILRPGDAYAVPPHILHGARTFEEGVVVLDVFTPVRDDYRKLADEAAGE